MMDAQICVQLKLGLTLWCCEAHIVVHAVGWRSTKQQCTVLVMSNVQYIYWVTQINVVLHTS
jgi:hypothetical protein